MKGRIVKGIAGFYYIYAEDGIVYECKAKGIFRKENQKPMVGDDVTIEVVDQAAGIGNLTAIATRRNELLRPVVANVDQALVIFASKTPDPNFNLLDRFLIMTDMRSVPVIICMNKADLISEAQKKEIADIYREAGCDFLFVSAKTGDGMEHLREKLQGKTTTVAGPSGAGKSTIVNQLLGRDHMEVGELSKRIDRGKNTTRHAELLSLDADSFLVDTPGFTSLYVEGIEKEQLRFYYPELAQCEGQCRYDGCVHVTEPGCKAKALLEEKQISRIRYENYLLLYEELKQKKRY